MRAGRSTADALDGLAERLALEEAAAVGSASTDPAFIERFTREAQALARLQHPQIVTLHDFGRAGGHRQIDDLADIVVGEAAFLDALERGRALRPNTPSVYPYIEQMRETEKMLLAAGSDAERERIRARLRDLEWWAVHLMNSPGSYGEGP